MKLTRTKLIALVLAGAVALAAAILVSAGTTGIVSGVVRGEDGKAISGANVIISGAKLTTVTDANGYYVITNVAPGEYEIRAEMVGFANASVGRVSVTMDSTATVNFDMKQEAIKETTAVVTRPRPMISMDQINTLNLITSGQETLARTDPTAVNTVPGALSAVPGVLVAPDQTGLIHIRGGRPEQIGYYIEGIPITDPNSGYFSDNGFSTGVGRFQAYTGGFGAEYGNAIAGVLNEVKKTGDANPGMHVTSFGGSDAYRSAMTEVGGGAPGAFSYYVGSIVQKNDISGSPFMVSQEYNDNAAKLVWPGRTDSFTFLALQGRLHGDVGGTGYAPGDYSTQRYAIAGGVWSHTFDAKSFLTVRPYYIYTSVLQSMAHTSAPFPWVNDGSSRQSGLTVGYTSQLTDRQLLKVGGSLLSSNNAQSTQNPLIYAGIPTLSASVANVDTMQTSLYAEQQLKLAKWTLNAGARFDSISYSRGSLSDLNESSLTPRLGASYAIDGRTAWKVSWGKYTRFVPANTIYSVTTMDDGAGGTDTGTVLGSGSPQRSTAGEISFEKQVSDSVAYRITPYYANYENLSDNVGPDFPQYRTIGDGEARGIEFYVRKKMSSNWQGWFSYTYQSIKAGQNGGLLAYTTWDQRHTMSAVADYKLGKWDHTMRADFGSGIENLYVAGHANPKLVLTYSLNVAMPKSAAADSLSLSIYNVLNNRQVTQFNAPGAAYSFNGQRNVSLGFNRAF